MCSIRPTACRLQKNEEQPVFLESVKLAIIYAQLIENNEELSMEILKTQFGWNFTEISDLEFEREWMSAKSPEE